MSNRHACHCSTLLLLIPYWYMPLSSPTIPPSPSSPRHTHTHTHLRMVEARFSDDRAIHCGFGDRDHVHGSCCGCATGSGGANGICTSGEVCGYVHPVAIYRTTSRRGYACHSTGFHQANEPHPRRHVCPRIPQRQNRVGYERPKHSAMGRICQTRFRSRASTQKSPGYLRKPCTAGPTHGNETFYPV